MPCKVQIQYNISFSYEELLHHSSSKFFFHDWRISRKKVIRCHLMPSNFRLWVLDVSSTRLTIEDIARTIQLLQLCFHTCITNVLSCKYFYFLIFFYILALLKLTSIDRSMLRVPFYNQLPVKRLGKSTVQFYKRDHLHTFEITVSFLQTFP